MLFATVRSQLGRNLNIRTLKNYCFASAYIYNGLGRPARQRNLHEIALISRQRSLRFADDRGDDSNDNDDDTR